MLAILAKLCSRKDPFVTPYCVLLPPQPDNVAWEDFPELVMPLHHIFLAIFEMAHARRTTSVDICGSERHPGRPRTSITKIRVGPFLFGTKPPQTSAPMAVYNNILQPGKLGCEKPARVNVLL